MSRDKKLQCFQERAELFQRRWIEAVAHSRAADFALNPARCLKYFEVLRNRALRQRQHFDNLAANAGLALFEQSHNRHARRIANGIRQSRQFTIFGARRGLRMGFSGRANGTFHSIVNIR